MPFAPRKSIYKETNHVCYAVNVRGVWVDKIGELRTSVPCDPVLDADYATMPPDDACLCGVDVEATLTAAGVTWERDDCGDWHVRETGSTGCQPVTVKE